MDESDFITVDLNLLYFFFHLQLSQQNPFNLNSMNTIPNRKPEHSTERN